MVGRDGMPTTTPSRGAKRMDVESRVLSLEGRVSSLESRVAVAENNIDTINRKLDKIESNTTWVLRLVIGAIILAIVGFLISNPI